MYRAYALVTNFCAAVELLDFGTFCLREIGQINLEPFRELFKSDEVYRGNWVYEKEYEPPPGLADADVRAIFEDTEDILFLLRLYKVGDVNFSKHRIIKADGTAVVQFPYRIMNHLNVNSAFTTEMTLEECQPFLDFANGLRANQSWKAAWFLVARRFFLYGSGKEFLPQWDEVDRIVDYVTALEATLTPERDFSTARTANRTAKIASNEPAQHEQLTKLIKTLYAIRSSIVHGSMLTVDQKNWLIDNCHAIELNVRNVLVNGVQQIPSDEETRKVYLSSLYDVTDAKRGEEAWSVFCSIGTDEVRQDIAGKISKRTQKFANRKVVPGSLAK
jgi:hypothetical protein